MKYDIVSGSQDTPEENNDIEQIRSIFDDVLNGLDNNSFEKIKLRCLPTTIETVLQSGIETPGLRVETVLFGMIPFPESMLNDPIFLVCDRYNNLIVDKDGVLLQLLYEYTPMLDSIKFPYKLIRTTEYKYKNGLIARKFEGYL